MSKHLRVLRASGLVEEERYQRDSGVRLYRLRPEPLAELQTWLAEVQECWTEQLEAFKAYAQHAEKRSTNKTTTRGDQA